MGSRASIAKHPIHPMLVTFPIGLWVFSLISDIIFRAGGQPIWADMALYTMAGGIIGALLAAIPGFIDLLAISDAKARRTGIWHMVINLTVVILFVLSFYMRLPQGRGNNPAFVLSIIAIGLLLVSGWLGGRLVYVLGVGVEPHPDTRIRHDAGPGTPSPAI